MGAALFVRERTRIGGITHTSRDQAFSEFGDKLFAPFIAPREPCVWCAGSEKGEVGGRGVSEGKEAALSLYACGNVSALVGVQIA